MKRRVLTVIAVCSIMLGMVGLLRIDAMAEGSDDQLLHRGNVVFVTDESKSMKSSDPDDNRYDAIKLFLGEMANNGNYVGSVSFAGDIVGSTDIAEISGQAAKDSLLAAISGQDYAAWTNIGKALTTAVDMLDNGRNEALDSAVIILTDGNTEMPDKKQKAVSIEQKADAIERARQAGYKIYTICLNVNGKADAAEMHQIAEATGGEFAEVTSAEDLNDVETMFNKLIFNSFEDMNFANLNLQIGDDGMVSTEFNIPGVGVEEFNLLFQGELTGCELIDSKGVHYKEGDDTAVMVRGANFVLAKVPNPEGGTWQAIAYGDPNTEIRLRLLYNSNFTVVGELQAPDTSHVGDRVRVLAHIKTSHGVVDAQGFVTDTSRYADMTAEAHVTFNGEEQTYPMSIASDGFLYELPLEREGTYYVTVSAENAVMKCADETVFSVSVDNLPPTATGMELSAHANVWPIIGGTASIDIDGAAIDPEGQPLTYEIDSTAFNTEDYELEGTKLTVKKFSIPKGSFTIRAIDTYGAYCIVNASFTSTNIGIIMAIGVLVAIIAALVAVFLVIRAAMRKALIGVLSVAEYNGSRRNPPQVQGSGKGSISLSLFAVTPGVLPPGVKFQCDGGKRQVWLVSKKPLYADNVIGTSKKIRVDGNGLEVRVSAAADMNIGIIVSFKSDKPDPTGMSF